MIRDLTGLTTEHAVGLPDNRLKGCMHMYVGRFWEDITPDPELYRRTHLPR